MSSVEILQVFSTFVRCRSLKTKGFEKRAQYYAAKAYSRQADKGDQYHGLKEIIFIAIADCILFPDKSEYKSKHTIRDEHTNEHDLKDFNILWYRFNYFFNINLGKSALTETLVPSSTACKK